MKSLNLHYQIDIYHNKNYELPKQRTHLFRVIAFRINPDDRVGSFDFDIVLKNFLYILIFFSLPLCGQNLHTNEPDVVYPILEEFIAENFKNKTPTFYRINKIDSITVEDLGYDVSSNFIRKIYGMRIKRGSTHTIKVDVVLLKDPKRFERTLKHELGHVFDLPHLSTDHYLEFMSREHWLKVQAEYQDPEIWKRINTNYYKSLMK